MLASSMILKEFRDACVARLERAGVYNAEADAERIIRAAFDGAAPPLGYPLADMELARLDAITFRREQREPLARILGRTTFCDLPMKVEPGVFRPYPETEALIEVAVELFADRQPRRILDLGTGTGCLLLVLLHIFPDATGVGIDNNAQAVRLGHDNALALGVAERAQIKLGDWTAAAEGTFDLVVSNPPRVPTRKISMLLPEMRDHDPVSAYDGGNDGLDFYRCIARDFARITSSGGVGVFQSSDARSVQHIFRKAGHRQTRVEVNYLRVPHSVSVFKS